MNKFNNEVLETHKTMIIDAINDQRINDDNLEDLHHEVFNTDYFIIGYYDANKWIEDNFTSTFEAIEIVKEYEVDNFGEFNTEINSEKIANMLSYICGEYIVSGLGSFDTLDELKTLLDM